MSHPPAVPTCLRHLRHHRRPLVAAALATATLLAACGDGPSVPAVPDTRPPRVCRSGAPKEPWAHEVTSEMGLAPRDGFVPQSTSLVAGDLDGDGFVDLIAAVFPAQREPVGSVRTRFVLMNRPSPSAPGRRVFVDATDASGLLATRDGAGGRGLTIPSLGDIDNDGDLDVVGCPAWGDDAKDGCAAFLNDGKGHFVLAPPSDLDTDVYFVSSSTLVDFDRDGILDFFPGTMGAFGTKTSAPRLFRGNGDGTFTNIAATVGMPPRRSSTNNRINFGITACDLDGDGDPDLLTANYARNPNEAFLNEDGILQESARGLGVDHDDEEDPTDDVSYQCYCAEVQGRCAATVPAPPRGFCPGRGWQAGVSDKPYNLGGNTFSLTCGDIDDDGDNDVMTAEVRHGDVGRSSDPSGLLLNPSSATGAFGRFERLSNPRIGLERPHEGLSWDEGDNIAVFVDLDLDGKKDIFLASSNYPGTHPWVFRQKDDRTFEDATTRSGLSHPSGEGPAFADFDNDGDLDLVIGSGSFNGASKDNAIHAYENDLAGTANVARIRIVGRGRGASNASGIGARVRVTAGGRKQYKDVQGSYGHSNTQNDTFVFFGLGASCDMEEIEVRWPNAAATTTRYANVRANYAIEIREGDPEVHYGAPLR